MEAISVIGMVILLTTLMYGVGRLTCRIKYVTWELPETVGTPFWFVIFVGTVTLWCIGLFISICLSIIDYML